MGWKTLKDRFRIEHIVQVRDGKILIGSPYVSDLITVHPDGTLAWGAMGRGSNEDLHRYFDEMAADPEEVIRCMQAEDTFTKSLPVFTYDHDGNILEKQCEAYEWPNVTHDGMLQYENTFSADRAYIVKRAKCSAQSIIESGDSRLEELRQRISDVEKWRGQACNALAKLNTDYPESEPCKHCGQPDCADPIRPCVGCGATIGHGAWQYVCDECGDECCTACSNDGENNTVVCDGCYEEDA